MSFTRKELVGGKRSFVDSHIMQGFALRPDSVRCDFGDSVDSSMGLHGIEVYNHNGETWISLYCAPPRPRPDTYFAKTSDGKYCVGESGCGWDVAPRAEVPKGAVTSSDMDGWSHRFDFNDATLKASGIASGLRGFVESLGLPVATKMQVIDAIGQVHAELKQK